MSERLEKIKALIGDWIGTAKVENAKLSHVDIKSIVLVLLMSFEHLVLEWFLVRLGFLKVLQLIKTCIVMAV